MLIAVLLSAACGDCDGKALAPTVSLLVPSQDLLPFGEVYVGGSRTLQLIVRAAGTGDVRLEPLRVEGDGAFTVEEEAPAFLGHGSSHTLVVRFSPAEVRAHAGFLVLANDSENAPELRVALTGTGLAQPSCDDGNPCTDETFDADAGRCRATRRTGPCDDGSACTVDDLCVEGVCLGTALVCNDESSCTRDLCDPKTGCLFLPDPAACEDDNPCTAGTCDPARGCSYTRVMDGTPCGPITGCDALPLCALGVCRNYRVPDGTPCSDGDLCTTGDTCRAGACEGTRVQQPQGVVDVLRSFGAEHSQSVVFSDGRILFLDQAGAPGGGSSFLRLPAGRATLSLVRASASGLELLDALELDAMREPVLRRVREGVAAILAGGNLTLFEAVGDRLVRRGGLALNVSANTAYLARFGDTLYVADYRDKVRILSVADLDHPQELAPLVVGGQQRIVLVDEPSRRLIVGGDGFEVFDLVDPLHPSGRRHFAFGGVSQAVTNGRVVVAASVCCPSREQSVLSAADFSLLAKLPISGVPNQGCALEGDRLFCIEADGEFTPRVLKVFNLRDPTKPALVATANLVSDHVGDLEAWISVAGARVAVRGTETSPARVFELVELESASLRELTGPAHGSLAQVLSRPDGLLVADPMGLHSVEVPASGPLRWRAGRTLEQPAGLLLLSAGSPVPALPLAPDANNFTPMIRWTNTLLPVVDGSDVASPRTVGSISATSTDLSALLASDGRWLYAVRDRLGTSEAVLHVYDLTTFGGFSQQPVAVAALDFVPPGCQSYTKATALSDDGRLLGIATQLTGPRCQNGGNAGLLVVVDVSQPRQPVVRASGAGWTYVSSVAVHGSRVVTLEGQPDLWGGTEPYTSTALSVFDETGLSPAGLGKTAALTLPKRANHFLGFDGRRAFLSTHDGVTVVDVSATPPQVLANIDTVQPPISAAFVGERLYVTGASRLSVIEPPCPPP